MNEPIYRLRSTGQYVKFTLALIFVGLFVLSLYLDPYSEGFFPPLIFALGGALVSYVFFFRPALYADRDGLKAINWFTERTITWKNFERLDNRFGMHLKSTTHSDPVTSYPGSGGIARGREQLSPSSPLAKTQTKETFIRLHNNGQHNHTASLKEASSLISRMADEFGQASPDRPRKLNVDPLPIGLLVIGIALIALGLMSSIPGN